MISDPSKSQAALVWSSSLRRQYNPRRPSDVLTQAPKEKSGFTTTAPFGSQPNSNYRSSACATWYLCIMVCMGIYGACIGEPGMLLGINATHELSFRLAKVFGIRMHSIGAYSVPSLFLHRHFFCTCRRISCTDP